MSVALCSTATANGEYGMVSTVETSTDQEVHEGCNPKYMTFFLTLQQLSFCNKGFIPIGN